MSAPVTPSEIIRCLKHYGYAAEDGARYCRVIALGARGNPWADPGDAEAYEEAARRLQAEADQNAATCRLTGKTAYEKEKVWA